MNNKNMASELIEKYGITGVVKFNNVIVPIINIPMMSDEKWQRITTENAIHNFSKFNGREPENEAEAIKWQRAYIAMSQRKGK